MKLLRTTTLSRPHKIKFEVYVSELDKAVLKKVFGVEYKSEKIERWSDD